MTPLQMRILMGLEDTTLDKHIQRLEFIKSKADGGCGLAPGEEATLATLYQRLDEITEP
jgi:hypothetical protein